MSKTILQQFFDGEITPSDDIKCKDPEYIRLERKIDKEKEYFLGLLPPGNGKRFEETAVCICSRPLFTAVNAFHTDLSLALC